MSLQNPITTTRAEQIPIENVGKIFVPPELYYSLLLSKKHTVIFGPRECGKSMVESVEKLPDHCVITKIPDDEIKQN